VFSPQHFTVWSLKFAQNDFPMLLDAMEVAEVIPVTRTGAVRVVVVPSPSWPETFIPQHLICPEVRSAQTEADDAEMPDAPERLSTVTAAVELEVELFPSCLYALLLPQHRAVPSVRTTQEKPVPEVSAPAVVFAVLIPEIF
jgi:hypothetical protein